MADYRDIIAGTINNIVDKVKEVAESGAVRDIYEHGASRAKSYGRMAKLTFAMNGDAEELRKVYAEIGRLYYEQAKDSPEGFYAPLFAQAGEIAQRILDAEAEIQAMKAEFEAEYGAAAEPDIDVDICEFDEVVSATENDGAGESKDE